MKTQTHSSKELYDTADMCKSCEYNWQAMRHQNHQKTSNALR